MGERFDVQAEQARLQALPMAELKREFERVWGWRHTTNNRSTLIRRILWRRQYGPLSEAVVRRAREIAAQVLVKEIAPPGWPGVPEAPVSEPVRDSRLPMPGTVLTREYRGQTVVVSVLVDGFDYSGVVYPSLSAVASEIAGSHVNGFHFFRLGKKKERT
jgi:hypothetical protein